MRVVQQGAQRMQQRKEVSPELDSELQGHIGRHLKAAYEDILSQPVPDRFRQLLEQLDRQEGDAEPNQEDEHDGQVLRP